MSDIKKMQIGQLVDFCISYNARHKKSQEESSSGRPRKATQDEINAFFG